LTGVIAALIGQGLSFYDSARFGVFIHGLAGDLAAKKIGQTSLIAGDILNFLPAAFRKIKIS
ncbi:MAG: NAD(P)H-hydrate dehydratase, partial [Candidatus Omnitrophica bacterium]|nr:NAD(P)H-hydrate dehydratase [Candidatus Omnitrophota bacterium]